MAELFLPAEDGLAAAPTSRRGFFKRFGAVGVGVAAVAAGCDSNDDNNNGTAVTLNFSNDFGVLNYAYALEQLEAAFYAQVVANQYTGITADERTILQDLAKHEAIHRDFLKAALGTNAIGNLEVDFSSIDFSSRTSVLGTALVFEDLGVAAYNGAGRYLASDTFLTLAGKIVSVEARHASIIAGLITPNAIAGSGVINAQGLDRALPPSQVLAAASTYIATEVNLTGVPA